VSCHSWRRWGHAGLVPKREPLPVRAIARARACGLSPGSLPNEYCDPKIAADLFEEALDEYLLCDDLGINVVSNEHHAGINCLFGASPLILGVLARQTKKVRILSLGTLITVRKDPVRVAEEYATADVMCRGRLEIGFVKSGGSEMASGNANPIGIVDRFWEAIDLVIKALSHRPGTEVIMSRLDCVLSQKWLDRARQCFAERTDIAALTGMVWGTAVDDSGAPDVSPDIARPVKKSQPPGADENRTVERYLTGNTPALFSLLLETNSGFAVIRSG